MEIGREIVFVSHLLKRNVDRITVKHGLSVNQSHILMYLHDHGGTAYQKDLEEVVHLRRSSITVHLQKLEKGGLIERENVDAKQKCLVLTEEGELKVKEIQQIFVESERRLAEIMQDDGDKLVELLVKLKEVLIKEENDV